jgi:hypothetical protein
MTMKGILNSEAPVDFDLNLSIDVLGRTPATLQALLTDWNRARPRLMRTAGLLPTNHGLAIR